MKKLCLFLVAIILCVQFVGAQQTQADLDKMMKQAQEQMKKMGNDTSVNNMLKNLQSQQKQMSDAMKNRPANATSNASAYANMGDYGNVDNWKFPAKNVALLAALPKKIFTKIELVNFLNDIYTQLVKKLPATISTSVQAIAAKYNNNANKMADEAVAGWYTNYREESLLLIIKAAANAPDNDLLLNNCAAILNMGGIEQKAIPILKYILESHPGSSMVLNNLGQAYAGLGETDTAMYYLGRSIKIEPTNPEANNTAGQIEAAKGNIQKAISYFEQSITAAYTKPAALKLRKIKNGSSIVQFVRPRVHVPEYFNQFKYKLPEQCTSTNEAAVAEAEYKAFKEMVDKQLENYVGMLTQLQQKLLINQSAFSDVKIKKDDFMSQPFYECCGIMSRDLMKDFMDNLPQYDKKFYADYALIENNYELRFQQLKSKFDDKEKAAVKAGCCGEGNTSCCVTDEEKCKAYNNLADEFLPQYAELTKVWQNRTMDHFKQSFDEMAFWGYLFYHPLGDDYFRLQCFYPLITQYLSALSKVATTKIIKPCIFKPATASSTSNKIKEMECPGDIEIPFIVGKFEISCDKVSFKAGEGLVFSYEKNLKTNQSTVSVGAGLKFEAELKLGPIKGGVSASVGESFFMSFDGDNKFSDGGLKFNAKASAGIEGEAGSVVKVKKDFVNEKTGIEYTLGVYSGWSFDEGPFKGIFEPTVIQINKNVKMYNN